MQCLYVYLVMRYGGSDIQTFMPVYRCEIIAHILHMRFVVVKWLQADHTYMKAFSFNP